MVWCNRYGQGRERLPARPTVRSGDLPTDRPSSAHAETFVCAHMSHLRRALRYAFSDGIPLRSGCVALIVGTILNLINQGDAIFGAMTINWTKIVLTYVVPYAVSTYGAVSYAMSRTEE
jgi:hypothetical protein